MEQNNQFAQGPQINPVNLNPNPVSSEKKEKSILIPLISAIVLTAIIVGGAMYWWMISREAVLNTQIDNLQNQVGQLSDQISTEGNSEGWTAYNNNDIGLSFNYPTDWKTYQNEDLGIKFSYPKDWHLSPSVDWYVYFGEIEGKVLLGKELSVSPYTGDRDPLYKIFKITHDNPLENAIKFLSREYDPLYYKIELQEEFKFKEKQAQKILITSTESLIERGIEAKIEIVFVTLDNNSGFIIPLPTKEQSDIISKILLTFTFLK